MRALVDPACCIGRHYITWSDLTKIGQGGGKWRCKGLSNEKKNKEKKIGLLQVPHMRKLLAAGGYVRAGWFWGGWVGCMERGDSSHD